MDGELEAVLASVPESFAPFDAKEIEGLRLYHRLVEELDRRTLANEKTFTFEISNEGSLASGVDEEQLAALATTLRKLAWAQKDPGTFDRITNSLCRRAHERGTPEGESMLQRIKEIEGLRADAEKQSRVAHYAVENRDGSTTEYTPKLLCDIVVNGVFFHSDSALYDQWEKLGGFKNPAVSMILTTTFKDFTQFFRAVDLVVQRILETPTLVSAGQPA